VQLAGCEARWVGEAARIAESLGADIVDLNMGCPARLVTGKQSGSALMRDLGHAMTLIEAAVDAVSVPVTLKMRLGWDSATINAPELARRAEAAGVRMIVVHGRTRCQFFNGRADWDAIRAVKQAVSVPVFANGDATSVDDVIDMIGRSGADGVMIGRGAYGAPRMPGRIARALIDGADPGDPPPAMRAEILREQFDAMLSHYGEPLGLRMARKHFGWAVARECGDVQAAFWRRRLCTEDDAAAASKLIAAFYAAERGVAA
jgi:tRNA-dihydrouridine synthase B